MNKTFIGDCKQTLSRLAQEGIRVQTTVTSPPYFKLRDYGVDGQIGQEASAEDYISSIVEVFRKVKDVTLDSGTLWLNIGDSYGKDKQLLMIPARVALALQADGWILRSDIIWQKPNAMPSSTKDRPTTDHEYIFLFAKQKEYFYDADAIREPHVTFSDKSKMSGGRGHFGVKGGTPEQGKNTGNCNLHAGRWDQAFHPLGRNKRTVWSVPLGKFKGAHFAVFPPALIESCVLAGSRPGDIILDPFMGSGTTAGVALKHGRQYIGCELNSCYHALQTERISSILRIKKGK